MDDAPALARVLAQLRGSPPANENHLARAELRDIGPAWLLHDAIARLRDAGARVELEGAPPEHFAYFDELRAREAGTLPPPPRPTLLDRLAAFGQGLKERGRSWFEALVYGGRLIASAALAWRSLKRLRLPSIVRHMHETGVQAIPIVAVIAMLISVISAYIGAQQLRPFGAEIFTVDLVAIGVLRELGVLLTAIMVAGRTGEAPTPQSSA